MDELEQFNNNLEKLEELINKLSFITSEIKTVMRLKDEVLDEKI